MARYPNRLLYVIADGQKIYTPDGTFTFDEVPPPEPQLFAGPFRYRIPAFCSGCGIDVMANDIELVYSR